MRRYRRNEAIEELINNKIDPKALLIFFEREGFGLYAAYTMKKNFEVIKELFQKEMYLKADALKLLSIIGLNNYPYESLFQSWNSNDTSRKIKAHCFIETRNLILFPKLGIDDMDMGFKKIEKVA